MKAENKMKRLYEEYINDIISLYKQEVDSERAKQTNLGVDPIRKFFAILKASTKLDSINPFLEETDFAVSDLYEEDKLMAYEYFKCMIFYIQEGKSIQEIEDRIEEVRDMYSDIPEDLLNSLFNVNIDARYEVKSK